jgi:hypothetical protein
MDEMYWIPAKTNQCDRIQCTWNIQKFANNIGPLCNVDSLIIQSCDMNSMEDGMN